jgi:hypothetical protein
VPVALQSRVGKTHLAHGGFFQVALLRVREAIEADLLRDRQQVAYSDDVGLDVLGRSCEGIGLMLPQVGEAGD